MILVLSFYLPEWIGRAGRCQWDFGFTEADMHLHSVYRSGLSRKPSTRSFPKDILQSPIWQYALFHDQFKSKFNQKKLDQGQHNSQNQHTKKQKKQTWTCVPFRRFRRCPITFWNASRLGPLLRLRDSLLGKYFLLTRQLTMVIGGSWSPVVE